MKGLIELVNFLKRIISGGDEDLSKIPWIHKRFTRYSRGTFAGPAVQLYLRGKKMWIKGSMDYEDILANLVLENMPDTDIIADGIVMTAIDPDTFLERIIPPGRMSQVEIKKKKRKWDLIFSGTWKKDELLVIYEEILPMRGYTLLNLDIEGNKSISFKIKKSPPKGKGSYDFNKVIKFCTATLPSDDDIKVKALETLLPDFMDDADGFRKIKLENEYDITGIEIPKNAKGNKRLAAIRKGTITRSCDIDGTVLEKEYEFRA